MKFSAFYLALALFLVPQAHAEEICEKTLKVVCESTAELRKERSAYVQGLKQKISAEAEIRAKKRLSAERGGNYFLRLFRKMTIKNQEVIAVSQEMLTDFDQDIVSAEIVENLKNHLEVAITDSDFDVVTKLKLIQKMRNVVVGNFSDYVNRSGLNTSLLSQLFSAHCGMDGLVDNAFATKLDGHDYVLICPGWLISLNQLKSKRDVMGQLLWVLTHEIAHHIDARDFESEYAPMISCVKENYLSRFAQSTQDQALCGKLVESCEASEGKTEDKDACIEKAIKDCDHQVAISHMGELSADTWAAQVSAQYLKAEGFSAAESAEFVTQNLMKLCGSRDEGVHTSGDFRITETALGNAGIREIMGCEAKETVYCQM